MVQTAIKVIQKIYPLFFLYANLCASLSRFRIGSPVCDNVFIQLKCYTERSIGVLNIGVNGHFHSCLPERTLKAVDILSSISFHSDSGVDPLTIPAPVKRETTLSVTSEERIPTAISANS